ncbi:hypothetical protein [Paenibacillus sp. MBLB4367]|uniref:hypothetical protein n=1 Tax=Paenibacillus sp. MBLB4367 TaxID=3384767 RepID=UPI003907FE24
MGIRYKYSTGPVENAIFALTLPGESRTFFAKAVNNGSKTATVKVVLFALNGKKRIIRVRSLPVKPGESNLGIFNVGQLLQFEVVFIVNSAHVLVSGWGKNEKGRLVSAHRFTQNELHRTIL